MFTDSVWQSQGSDSHRGWITLASFTVQTLAVATLLVLPLLHTEGLPPMHSVVEPVFSPPLAGGTSEIRPPRSQLSNLANAAGSAEAHFTGDARHPDGEFAPATRCHPVRRSGRDEYWLE